MKTITKPTGQTWDNYLKSIEDPILRGAIECHIAMWCHNHNAEETIEVSEWVNPFDDDTESEEEIQRWR